MYSIISNIFVLFLISEHVALDPTFSFPLLFGWYSGCLSFVYLETMFDSLRSLLARHMGPLIVFLSEMGSCLSWSFPCLFPKQLYAALILAYISSFVVALRCEFCPRYLNSATFFYYFADLLVFLHCLCGSSCNLSFLCVF